MGIASSRVTSYQVCNLPVISYLPTCYKASTTNGSSINSADFPRLLAIQHRALDDFLIHSAAKTEVALNIKHAELAVQDLAVLVQSSNLTVKTMLSDTLSDFVLDAKAAARGLQVFSAQVHGTIDSISVFNAYTLQEVRAAKRKGGPGSVEATLLCTFRSSMDVFSSHIAHLLVEASSTAASLDRLAERLALVYALCEQETFTTGVAQDELLSQLWTMLGGNKHQLRDLQHRSMVLLKVQEYRSVAAAYIAVAEQSLTGIDADLTDLRGRMMGSVVDVAAFPLEVQIASIERGLDRLREETTGRVGSGDRRAGDGYEFTRLDGQVIF
ncbi:hypothetical protein C8Q79DRAFT_902597 [Trametes meyenii]|nr:hypothetical protein C8Q79DRAFT_902597 [Trametes meyenii]